jgi:surface protein
MKTIKVNNENIKRTIKSLIEEYGNVSLNHLDVSNVTDMSGVFFDTNFNGDISKWNVSKVTNMNCMFSHSNFNHDIGNWNVSKVTDMKGLFYRSNFNGDISNWDVSNVRDMRYMFFYAKNFNQNISNWNIDGSDITSIFRYDNWDIDVIKEHYNGKIPKGKILDVLHLEYPEYFI